MISREQFHTIYTSLPFGEPSAAEEFLYGAFVAVINDVFQRSGGDPQVHLHENLILDYVLQEYIYMLPGQTKEALEARIRNRSYVSEFIRIVSDKVLFNEITPYHPVTLLSHQSPVISTMELNINFILNRMTVIREVYPQKDIVLDMLTKVFLMFKSLNYLLSSGFETEAFSTWRTIHELECVIRIIALRPYLVPTYLKHIVYNTAFRNEFEDKDAQQATIDELKANMKAHDLKSKDMKKYIEYGWLYSVKDAETLYPGLKLNFRNGLEVVAGLERYSTDYEMSSEVAHSSPLLIYSNKPFFMRLTIVRSYESFLRLEEIFFQVLKQHDKVDSKPYENMRKLYLEFSKRILKIETAHLDRLAQEVSYRKKKWKG